MCSKQIKHAGIANIIDAGVCSCIIVICCIFLSNLIFELAELFVFFLTLLENKKFSKFIYWYRLLCRLCKIHIKSFVNSISIKNLTIVFLKNRRSLCRRFMFASERSIVSNNKVFGLPRISWTRRMHFRDKETKAISNFTRFFILAQSKLPQQTRTKTRISFRVSRFVIN